LAFELIKWTILYLNVTNINNLHQQKLDQYRHHLHWQRSIVGFLFPDNFTFFIDSVKKSDIFVIQTAQLT
jgi:hypothetical protein